MPYLLKVVRNLLWSSLDMLYVGCWQESVTSILLLNILVAPCDPLQLVYQWIVKPQTASKVNEMFLHGRTAFVFDMVRSSQLLHIGSSLKLPSLHLPL